MVLHHRISWAEDDVDAAVPLLSETLALFPSVRGCSFDRGFHSPSNRVRLDALLDCNVLPAKGTLSQKARARVRRSAAAASGGGIRHPQPGMPRPGPGPRARQGWLRSNGRSHNPYRQFAPDRPGAAESRAGEAPQSAAPRHPPRRLTAASRANAVGVRPGPGRGPVLTAEDRRHPRHSCETSHQPLIHGRSIPRFEILVNCGRI